MVALNVQRASGLLRQKIKDRRAKEARQIEFFERFREDVTNLTAAVEELVQTAASKTGLTACRQTRDATGDINASSLMFTMNYALRDAEGNRTVELKFLFAISYGSISYNGQIYVLRNSSDDFLEAIVSYIYSKLRNSTYSMSFSEHAG